MSLWLECVCNKYGSCCFMNAMPPFSCNRIKTVSQSTHGLSSFVETVFLHFFYFIKKLGFCWLFRICFITAFMEQGLGFVCNSSFLMFKHTIDVERRLQQTLQYWNLSHLSRVSCGPGLFLTCHGCNSLTTHSEAQDTHHRNAKNVPPAPETSVITGVLTKLPSFGSDLCR